MKASMTWSVILSIFSVLAWAGPVNINQAPAEELAIELHGVGPVKAKAIIAFRENNGPFLNKEQIMDVNGIGPKTFEKNKENILLE